MKSSKAWAVCGPSGEPSGRVSGNLYICEDWLESASLRNREEWSIKMVTIYVDPECKCSSGPHVPDEVPTDCFMSYCSMCGGVLPERFWRTPHESPRT